MTMTRTDIESQLDSEHLEVFSGMPVRVLDPGDVAGAVFALRESAAARRAGMQPVPVPSGVTTEDRAVPGPDGAPEIMVRLYRPASLPSPAPALLWVHGGGMVMGSVEMNDAYCGRLAERLSAIIASVEYRLAPEHPYPAPLDDCYAGLSWLSESVGELGVDPTRIAIGGASSGAGVAAGLALLARDRGEIDVCFQFLVYPMLDDRNSSRSSHAINDGRVWNRETNEIGWNAYLAGEAGREGVDAYAAPARAVDLGGLPPAYICVGTMDMFVDEDIAYAQAMLAADVPVELHVYPGAFHGSPNSIPGAALSVRWSADEEGALDRALNGPS